MSRKRKSGSAELDAVQDSGRVSIESDIAQGLHFVDPASGAVVPPIQPSTTFARAKDYSLVNPDSSYTRDENPTLLPAEAMLSRLEGGRDALLFSSGMSAAMTALQTLRPGEHIVVPRVMYWGLRNWIHEFCERWGISVSQFDATDPDDLALRVKPGATRFVWIETPSNPTWDVVDIEMAAEIAHSAGAELIVDSTVATPVLTTPISFGADIVLHSATKYLNGHGDVLAGALVAAERSETWSDIRRMRAEGGAIPGPFEAWLLQRGMRTLFLRVQRASQSAMTIAEHFCDDERLAQVLYPGLPEHPGNQIAQMQMQGGFGGMLSLLVAGGPEAALSVAGRCNVFIRATSLGGVESLIEHRYSIEGVGSPIPENLLRLSVGIEQVEDLIADLDQALA